jgi:hypothetical protein
MGIPIILIRPATARCSRCGTILKRGTPRFGPREVKCGECGHVMETGLTPWADLPATRRIIVGLGEIIAPSRWGKVFFVLLLEFVLASLYVCGLTIVLAGISAFLPSWAAPVPWVIAGVGTLALLTIPVVRLVRMVKESNQYSETATPVEWKAGIL